MSRDIFKNKKYVAVLFCALGTYMLIAGASEYKNNEDREAEEKFSAFTILWHGCKGSWVMVI